MRRCGWLVLVLAAAAPVWGIGAESSQPPVTPREVPGAVDCLEVVQLAVDPLGLRTEVALTVLEALGVAQTWVPNQDLPPPQYLEHPPQYIPPSGEVLPATPPGRDEGK